MHAVQAWWVMHKTQYRTNILNWKLKSKSSVLLFKLDFEALFLNNETENDIYSDCVSGIT